MKYIYHDKNGRKIEVGMTLRHNDGDTDTVIATTDADGDEGLGFSCSEFEAYPLHQFELSEWEIVQ
ncbi:hypothetical protein QMP26_41440 (plasmid) [Enterocloster clostridioformis]